MVKDNAVDELILVATGRIYEMHTWHGIFVAVRALGQERVEVQAGCNGASQTVCKESPQQDGPCHGRQ